MASGRRGGGDAEGLLPHRKGLEQRVSELEALHSRDALLLLEAGEARARLQQQLVATTAAASAAQGELAFLAPLKEYAGDLQVRLKVAKEAAEDDRTMGVAANRRAAAAERERDEQTARAEAAEAQAATLAIRCDDLLQGTKNVAKLKHTLEQSFVVERASLADALRAACGRVEQLEAEVKRGPHFLYVVKRLGCLRSTHSWRPGWRGASLRKAQAKAIRLERGR
jgi:hypothetical protein